MPINSFSPVVTREGLAPSNLSRSVEPSLNLIQEYAAQVYERGRVIEVKPNV